MGHLLRSETRIERASTGTLPGRATAEQRDPRLASGPSGPARHTRESIWAQPPRRPARLANVSRAVRTSLAAHLRSR